MTSWFTNGWLRLGSKKRGQVKDENDKENQGSSYPTNKKAKKVETSPFAGGKPADTGSWFLCQDRDGMMYWWNDVTGQWTYQLYSPNPQLQQQQQGGYPHIQHQHHLLQQQNQQMIPAMQHQMSYPHLYNPGSNHHHIGGSGGSSMYMAQQWGLLSPSTAAMAPAPTVAASAVGTFGLGWGSSVSSGHVSFFDVDDEEDENVNLGRWEKFFDNRGRPVWIHSKTGIRTTVNPEPTIA